MEGKGEACLPTVEEAEDNEPKLDNSTHKLLLYHYRLFGLVVELDWTWTEHSYPYHLSKRQNGAQSYG
jgi:hypothetical protein